MLLGIDEYVTATEMADILWLAPWMEVSTITPAAAPRPSETSASGGRSEPESPPPAKRARQARDTARLYRPDPQAHETGRNVPASPVRSPEGRALPGALALSRSLRPLMRRVPSRTRQELDIEATVEHIAEQLATGQHTWQTVLRPVPEPWLEVALVIDTAPSLRIWRDTLAALATMLQRCGFRDVRVWRCRLESDGTLALSAGETDRGRPRGQRPAAELLDPAGRRLILVCTDCVAAEWHEGAIWEQLAAWGRHCPTGVVQLLPYRLWDRTALYRRIAAARPGGDGLANHALQIETPQSRRPRAEDAVPAERDSHLAPLPVPFPIPIVTLEPAPLLAWARAVAGMGDESIPVVPALPAGSLANAELSPRMRPEAEASTPDELLRRFAATASRDARLLAAYLTQTPLSLPVMRTVQDAMFPAPSQTHLAEVVLSGLVELAHPALRDSHTNEILYRFLPEARDLLQNSVRASDLARVLKCVSEHFQRRYGQARDFQALTPDPFGLKRMKLNAETRPFAEIATATLLSLGGVYASAGRQLRARLDRQDRVAEWQYDLIPIPAGEFIMGGEEYNDEKPIHTVYLDAYHISKYPVTVAEYLEFCKQTRRKRPDAPSFNPKWASKDHPIVNVSWDDAVAYCEWLSKETDRVVTLPTEAEWEKAARGTDGRQYPWSEKWDGSRCANSVGDNDLKGTMPVGSYPTGASPYGVQELSGNVYEWCSDWYAEDYYAECASEGVVRNPQGPSKSEEDRRVLRGGSWDYSLPRYFRSAYRFRCVPDDWASDVGFRCVIRSDAYFRSDTEIAAVSIKPISEAGQINARLRSMDEGVTTRPTAPFAVPLTVIQPASTPPFIPSNAELILIPAGEFLMGSEEYDDEKPIHTVYLDAYHIGKYPVTVAEYLEFCKATGRNRPEPPVFDLEWARNDHPIVNVSWGDAVAYCEWLSKKTGRMVTLPSEAEWEKASRGTDRRRYPWGDIWDAAKCANSVGNNRLTGTIQVGSYLSGASPYGVLDMSGNVWEWCSDRYKTDYYAKCVALGVIRNPPGAETGNRRVLRGCSWSGETIHKFRCSGRDRFMPYSRGSGVGFRYVVRSDTARPV